MFFLNMENFYEYNKKISNHNKSSSNIKFFSNEKKFTEYKTSSKYENVFLKLTRFSLNMKIFP